ncbi:MAG: Na+/H+ antiporter subunit E [Clostridiales bacterium]|nr:Na+/H+ antiporter subunit E [Clostridiales bacterium]
MLTALFLLWIAFNGRVTLEIAGIGAVIVAALYFFCVKFLDYGLRRELRILRMIPAALVYVAVLLKEIVQASFQLMRIMLRTKYEVKPQLITFCTPLKTTLAQSLLANSITLTPGTLSVFCEGEKLTVHCLDQSFAEGIENLSFQRRLMRLEKLGVK